MPELSEVLAQAEAEGITLTKRRLWHWSKVGLIQSPTMAYRGERGARSEYPADTLDRIRVISSALAERRDVKYALLALWRAGFPVDVRPLFEGGLAAIRALRERIRRDREAVERDDDGYVTLDEERPEISTSPLVRKLHKQLSGKELKGDELYGSIAYAVTLFYEPANPYLQDYLDDKPFLLDDHRETDTAIFRALSSFAQLPLDKGPHQILAAARPHFDPDNLEEIISDIGTERLREYDRELREFLLIVNGLIAIFDVLKQQQPKMRVSIEDAPPELQCWAGLVWTSFMLSPSVRSSYEQILQRHNQVMAEYSE